MGPRSDERGNARSSLNTKSFILRLQWGHARMSVETGSPELRVINGRWLQWGHARMSVETIAEAFAVTEQTVLQWGHARMSVETASPRAVRSGSIRFNGATLG